MKTVTLLFVFWSSIFFLNAQEMRTLEKENYKISYPANWQLDQSDPVTEFYLFSRLTNSNDKFSENISLISQSLAGMNINLDQYTEISVNQIKKFFNDKILKVEKHTSKDGTAYYEVIYTGTQEGSVLKFLQYNFLKNGIAYALTFTAEAAQFDAYKDVVYQIFNSFSLQHGTNN
jgi:hypothetical protein